MAVWIEKDDKKEFNNAIKKAMKDTGYSDIFFTVLKNRGIVEENDLRTYLAPNINGFSDVSRLKDLKKGMEILKESIGKGEHICIYGDYDVDGVCSTTILYKGIKALGGNVSYYIPDRREEGYGLNMSAVDKMKEMNCGLVFTCDNGIAATGEIRKIKELGMKCIVLDHHEPAFKTDEGIRIDIIPEADAVIDAKQSDCEFEFKEMCAGGISYLFIREFYKYMEKKLENEAEFFVFAMIATICDIVPLKRDNRIIGRNGLKIIKNRIGLNKGLDYLIDYLEIDRRLINEYTIGFRIGPCINAAGRLESALTAVRLFTSDDGSEVKMLAQRLAELNNERKKLTEDAVKKMLEKIPEKGFDKDRVIVVEGDADEAVIGIAAGRIKEYFYRPVIVLTKGEGLCKGSGRSIEGYNLFEALLEVRELFVKFGGHYMAAGMSLENENTEKLRKRLNENCRLTEEQLTEKIYIDKVIGFESISERLYNELYIMQPFGNGNPAGIMQSNGIRIESIRFVGKENKIIQLIMKDEAGKILNGIDFGGYDKWERKITEKYGKSEFENLKAGIKRNIKDKTDIVYEIGINEYNGIRNIQLKIIDFRFSDKEM